MTIDSSWIACLKEEVPAAFTQHPPFQPDAVFIDGQIRLMPAGIEGVVPWEDYIQRQFERHVARYFQKGVSCVILAFDDYANVPSAKNMTQAKRRKHVPSLEFNARDCLPPSVPTGEEFTRCISNRTFKSKVIQLVVHRLVSNLQCAEGQCLVVDYAGPPVRHYARSSGRAPEPIPGLRGGLGEADVKFVPYLDIYAKLQVDSVDGDSLPIALLQLERGHAGRVSVLRLQTRVKSAEDSAAAAAANPAAAAAAAKPAAAAAAAAKPAAAAAKPAAQPLNACKKQGRVYEFVDVRLLYEIITGYVVPQCVGRAGLPSHKGHEISMLVCLIGLSGTDFTRGLPLVSGKSLYDFLPDIWLRLCRSYDPGVCQLCPDRAADLLVSRIYHKKFQKHSPDSGLSEVLAAIQGSKLSEKTKARLPTGDVLRCTLRNVNWLLRYWRELDPPDPVQPEFGFARGRGGAVQFADS